MFFVDMADLMACYRGLESKTGGVCTMLTASEDRGTGQRGERSCLVPHFASFPQALKYTL